MFALPAATARWMRLIEGRGTLMLGLIWFQGPLVLVLASTEGGEGVWAELRVVSEGRVLRREEDEVEELALVSARSERLLGVPPVLERARRCACWGWFCCGMAGFLWEIEGVLGPSAMGFGAGCGWSSKDVKKSKSSMFVLPCTVLGCPGIEV